MIAASWVNKTVRVLSLACASLSLCAIMAVGTNAGQVRFLHHLRPVRAQYRLRQDEWTHRRGGRDQRQGPADRLRCARPAAACGNRSTAAPPSSRCSTSRTCSRLAPSPSTPPIPKIVWVGTGEAWTRNSVSVGDGIYKSTDGGENWTNVGLKDSEHIASILVDPKDSATPFTRAPRAISGMTTPSAASIRPATAERRGAKYWRAATPRPAAACCP